MTSTHLPPIPPEVTTRAYIGLYKSRHFLIEAKSSYEAQRELAKIVKAKKPWDVHVYLADQPINTSTL